MRTSCNIFKSQSEIFKAAMAFKYALISDFASLLTKSSDEKGYISPFTLDTGKVRSVK
jgi:hypothetical protein